MLKNIRRNKIILYASIGFYTYIEKMVKIEFVNSVKIIMKHLFKIQKVFIYRTLNMEISLSLY